MVRRALDQERIETGGKSRMTRTLTLGMTALLLLSNTSAFAESARERADETAIRAEIAKITQAYQNRDAKAAMAPYTQDYIAFDFMPPLVRPGYQMGYDATKAFIDSSATPPVVAYEDVFVKADHTLAYSHYIVHIVATLKNGKHIDFRGRSTDVWQKIDGKWMIVHEHNSLPSQAVSGGE